MEIVFIFLLMAMVMVFFSSRRKQRERRDLLESLDVGDEVITASGLYGMITEFDGSTVFIEVSDGVELKISRDTIANKVVYSDVNGDGSDS
ncbi:preprotein translocase subunit YajC [Candidatus Poriferisocius sp.]|uniref:preprotein translocase subunit YajC n=1 Tax=Candidatus Poriferisocius sp. TaxID=3101276 RepID=UPI003B01DFE2